MRVVITGATSGLGRELAVQLGRRGWRVAVTGRRRELLDETAKRVIEAGGEALPLYGSVTDDEEGKGHYAAVKAAWGGLDWAVLNAGVSDSMDAKKFSAENVRWTFDANVLGVARWIEAVLPDMLERRCGLIAGVASLAGFRGLPLSGPYSASKAALINLTASLAKVLAPAIRVNAVAPGATATDMNADWPEERREMVTKAIPMGRMNTPEDVAKAVVFLASDDTATITGQTLVVDGGGLLCTPC